MAHHVDTHTFTAADNLRNALANAEKLLVNPTAQTVEQLLTLLDEIEEIFEEFSVINDNDAGTGTNLDLRAEEGRWEGIINRISRKPDLIASAAASAGGLAALRAKHSPAKSFWWRTDAEVARRRKALLRRLAITIGSVVGIIALLLWGIQTLFPPSPEALLMLETNEKMEPFILEGEWESARQVVQETLTQLPTEPELWLWDAIFSEQIGDEARAQESLAQANDLLRDNPLGFWIALANQRMRVGNLDGAEKAALTAIDLDPNEAQGYFVLGSVAEFRGDNRTAIDLFEQTFTLAQDADPQLAVIARVRMGTLMQQFSPALDASPSPGPTATP